MPRTIEVRTISIPFRFAYGHAKATHRGVEALLCIARGQDGIEGYGEAVPRSYVTGETCESARADLARLAPRLMSGVKDLATFQGQLRALAEEWDGPFPACAACALDGAVTDYVARRRGVPLHEVLGNQGSSELRYTGSIGIGRRLRVLPQILLYRMAGMRRFKVKVGAGRTTGGLSLAKRLLGNGATFFADANATWDREEAIRAIEALSHMGVWAIEEPLRAANATVTATGQLDRERVLDERHYRDCAWLRERSPIPLIADESLISMRSFRAIVAYRAFDILNIRLSKLGGLAIAASVVDQARKSGLEFYVGAMVGESPVLATAGSHFASVHADYLEVQGHSHKILHRGSLTRGEPPMRRGGVVTLRRGAGLGLEVIPSRLDRVTTHRIELRP